MSTFPSLNGESNESLNSYIEEILLSEGITSPSLALINAYKKLFTSACTIRNQNEMDIFYFPVRSSTPISNALIISGNNTYTFTYAKLLQGLGVNCELIFNFEFSNNMRFNYFKFILVDDSFILSEKSYLVIQNILNFNDNLFILVNKNISRKFRIYLCSLGFKKSITKPLNISMLKTIVSNLDFHQASYKPTNLFNSE